MTCPRCIKLIALCRYITHRVRKENGLFVNTGVGPNEATTATKNALFDQCDRMIGRKTKRRASFFDSQATDMTDAVDKVGLQYISSREVRSLRHVCRRCGARLSSHERSLRTTCLTPPQASFDATLGGGRRTRPRVADTNGSSHSADEALEAALWGDSKLSATQLQVRRRPMQQ